MARKDPFLTVFVDRVILPETEADVVGSLGYLLFGGCVFMLNGD